MLFWLPIIILAYLFFSLASFGDKLILSGRANPKSYIFYVGMLNIWVIFLVPFAGKFNAYTAAGIMWAALTAFVAILGLYTMFIALEKFEASRVMPTIGAIQPILILILTGIFWGFRTITSINFSAFILLFIGSIAISTEKKITLTLSYLALTILSSLMFSFAYIFSKFVFLNQSFFQGLILISIFIFLFALMFLFDKELRSQIFSKKPALDKKTGIIFLFTQSAGGIANVLQSFAISLAPVSYLAVVNSLRGVQYVFLFLITLFFSFFFPKILKESISQKIIIQKVISILFIVSGLALLAIY